MVFSNMVCFCLRGCLQVKFYPGIKLVLGWNYPCLWWNVSYCLHVFAETKFHSGMYSSLSKNTGMKFHPRMKKRTSSPDEILKWVCFFLIFDLFVQICFPKLTCLNIMRVGIQWNIRPLYKKWSPKGKRMRATSKKSKM